jgi:hypothetical protein
LEAGILKSKQPAQPMAGLPPQAGATPLGGAEMYRIKEPSIGRGILLTVIVIVVAVIFGGGGWYVYQRFVVQSQSQSFNPEPSIAEPFNSSVGEVPAPEPTPVVVPEGGSDATATSSNITAEMKDQQILFGEPIDTDGDGLEDASETKLLTDAKNWDTDSDSLSDGDEVKIWHTDPLKPDSDGDGYPDGTEIKGGYNPNGSGKLFQPPTTTSQ